MPSLPKATLRTVSSASASVAQAKEHFSSLLRHVEKERTEVIVRRRGVAVAKLVPFSESNEPITGYGWMKGSAVELGDIVGPTGEEWDAADE